jgi:propanediol dehydratase small subunit
MTKLTRTLSAHQAIRWPLNRIDISAMRFERPRSCELVSVESGLQMRILTSLLRPRRSSEVELTHGQRKPGDRLSARNCDSDVLECELFIMARSLDHVSSYQLYMMARKPTAA